MLDRAVGRRHNERLDTLGQVALVGIATVVATVLGSRVVLNDRIRSFDEGIFDRLVPWLQDAEWLVDISKVVTDLGSKNLAYGAALVLAVLLVITDRSIRRAFVVLGTLVAIHGLQWLTLRVSPGVVPTEHVIGGGGPYYSGGVVRALVVSGMITFALTSRFSVGDRRVVWGIPIVIGLIEAGTRLVLGRHWPIDAVVALPIGMSLLWCHQQAVSWIEHPRLRRPTT